MNSLVVRDPEGKSLFRLDGDCLRDESGKVVGKAEWDDKRDVTAADRAAALLAGRSDSAERRVLLDLAPGDVMTPSFQADFGIPADGRVADIASPVKLVKRQAGTFFLENVGDAIQLVVASGDPDGAVPEINPGYTSTPFTTVGYALAAKLPRHLVSNADFDLERRTLRRLAEGLRLLREYRTWKLLTASASWAAANRVAVVAKWNGGALANPLTDLFAGLGASYIASNTLILPENAAQYFFQNANSTAMRDYVQSGGEMPKVVFARSKILSAGAPAYLWSPSNPTNVALVRSTAGGPPYTDTETDIPTSMTFRWNCPAADDGTVANGVMARRFFSSQDDCNWLVVAHNDVEVMLSNQIGALLVGALQ